MPSTPAVSFVDVTLSWNREDRGTTVVMQQLPQAGGWREVARTDDTEVLVRGLHPARSHVFAAAAVLEDGALEPEDEWETLRVVPLGDAGRPAVPDTPAGLAAAQDGGRLEIQWSEATDGVTATLELRYGSSWEDGVLIARDLPGRTFSWAWPHSGDVTILAKAVDEHGRACRVAAELDVTIQALDDHVTDATVDEGTGGWTETKTDVEVSGGKLQLTEVPPFGALTDAFASYGGLPCFALHWHTGTYEMAVVDVGQVERQRIEIELEAEQPLYSPLPFGAIHRGIFGRRWDRDGQVIRRDRRRTAASNSWRFTPLLPVDVELEINTSQTAAGAWDGWRPYVPGTYTFRRVQLRVVLGGDGLRYTRLPKLIVRRRLRNWKAEGTVEVGTVSAVTVVFDEPYQRTPVVVAQVLGSTVVANIGSVSTTQFIIQPLGSTATVAWHALGM